MAEVAICPNLLKFNEDTDDFITYQNRLDGIVNQLRELNIQLIWDNKYQNATINSYPWNILENRSDLYDICNDLFLLLFDGRHITVKKYNSSNPIYSTDILDSAIQWGKFLYEWSHDASTDNISKGIASNLCNQTLKNDITIISDFSALRFLKYPWLLRTNERLPVEIPQYHSLSDARQAGHYYYLPPDNWQSRCLRDESGVGYIDSNHNIWIWDHFHNDHWDVNFEHSDVYIKVTPDGRII